MAQNALRLNLFILLMTSRKHYPNQEITAQIQQFIYMGANLPLGLFWRCTGWMAGTRRMRVGSNMPSTVHRLQRSAQKMQEWTSSQLEGPGKERKKRHFYWEKLKLGYFFFCWWDIVWEQNLESKCSPSVWLSQPQEGCSVPWSLNKGPGCTPGQFPRQSKLGSFKKEGRSLAPFWEGRTGGSKSNMTFTPSLCGLSGHKRRKTYTWSSSMSTKL